MKKNQKINKIGKKKKKTSKNMQNTESDQKTIVKKQKKQGFKSQLLNHKPNF